jgi:hypothetical protein
MPEPKKRAQSARPGPVGKRELRDFLAGCSRESLVDQILGLFDGIEQVREHYHVRLRGEDEQVRARYRALITREFEFRGFTPPPLRIPAAKRAIAEYRKIAASVEGIADVMFHYVESGLTPFEDFGLEHDSLFNSILGMYRDALIHVRKHGLDREFVDRSYAIVQRGEQIGYGSEFQDVHDLAYGLPDADAPTRIRQTRGTMRGMSTDLERDDDRL